MLLGGGASLVEGAPAELFGAREVTGPRIRVGREVLAQLRSDAFLALRDPTFLMVRLRFTAVARRAA